MNKKIVWTIAGSDSSALSGIQNDLKTFEHLGVHGCSVITALSAQNECEISHCSFIEGNLITSQFSILSKSFSPSAIKIGMLGTDCIIQKTCHFLASYDGEVVLDPVLISSSGQALFEGDLEHYLNQIKKMFPFVTIVTPNLVEAEKLAGFVIKTPEDIKRAAETILLLGAKSVLIKGGHSDEKTTSNDYWTNGEVSFWLNAKRQPRKNYRGTGCAFASALTAALALGYDIKDTVIIAKMYVNRGIRLSEQIQGNHYLFCHDRWPHEEEDLPFLSEKPLLAFPKPFPRSSTLGLYPIVDCVEWLEKLLPLGVKTIQLRLKNQAYSVLRKKIKRSIQVANYYKAALYINDYWELAIELGAYGVHLGQEDIMTVDWPRLRQSGLRLGVSTHSYYEIARAHTFSPSYLAFGPIFETKSKKMVFLPQGLAKLRTIRRTLTYPLVAIGGIKTEHVSQLQKLGIDGIAMISSITEASDPFLVTKQLLKLVNSDAQSR